MDKKSPAHHLLLARQAIASGRRSLAYALLKTYESLFRRSVSGINVDDFLLDDSQLTATNPPTFARLKRCSRIIHEHADGKRVSVADVGGGKGMLSHFIHDCDYVLCEPTINGLHVEDLLDMNYRCDILACIHVLEHIDHARRKDFIAKLTRVSELVIINCPVSDGQPGKLEVQQLIYKHTRAPWTLEHMQCTLPSIEEVLNICGELNIPVTCFPGSNFAATLGYIFLDYIAGRSHDPDIKAYHDDIKRYVNERYTMLDSTVPSGDQFFILRCPGQPGRDDSSQPQ